MKKLALLLLLPCSMISYANNLNTSDSIKLLTINGQPHSQFERQTNLGTGDIVVGLRYEKLFEVSMEEHHVIRSPIFYLKFKSDNLGDYAISTPNMSELEAKKFATKPEFILTDETGKKVDYKLWSREDLLQKLMKNH